MTDNSPTDKADAAVTVRVDLTSQDLRTGTVRLPRQLHDRFEAGPLIATSDEDDSNLDLAFTLPGDLTGLQDFLRQHELRTNDAIVLHVDGKAVRLEPYYRRSRTQHQDNADGESHQGLFGEVHVPAQHAADSSQEDAELLDTLQLNPELQPGLFDDRQAATAEDPYVEGVPESADSMPPAPGTSVLDERQGQTHTEAPVPAESNAQPPVASWPGAEANGSEFDAWAEGDDLDLDELDQGLASFSVSQEHADSLQQAEPPEAHSAQAAGVQADADDDLPPLPAWQAPPGPHHSEAAAAETGSTEPQPTPEQSLFHVVQRRPFTPRGRSMPAVTRTSRTGGFSQSASTQKAQSLPATTAAGVPAADNVSTSGPSQSGHGIAPPEASPADQTIGSAAAGDSTGQRITRYLDSPDLPSILQAKQLAQELGLTEQEAGDALQELSQLPDSRLSPVRPGFYLLKRDRQG